MSSPRCVHVTTVGSPSLSSVKSNTRTDPEERPLICAVGLPTARTVPSPLRLTDVPNRSLDVGPVRAGPICTHSVLTRLYTEALPRLSSPKTGAPTAIVKPSVDTATAAPNWDDSSVPSKSKPRRCHELLLTNVRTCTLPDRRTAVSAIGAPTARTRPSSERATAEPNPPSAESPTMSDPIWFQGIIGRVGKGVGGDVGSGVG